MDEKYIELLIEKCTELKTKKKLLIHYSEEIEEFIQKIIIKAKDLEVNDIYLDKFNLYKEHEILKNSTIEEINKHPYFDKSIWNTYAKKDACFLIFETEYPGVMDDIEPEKITAAAKRRRETREIYRRKVEKCELSWCIAAYPGKLWASSIFKENSYQNLKEAIFRMCMIDKENPMKSWDEHLEKQDKIRNYLNNLNIEKLIYKNNLGTNLEICLPENYIYSSAKDNNIIANMPSYEIFASPYYKKVNGIVYASKPLMYNSSLIKDFWLKFADGKVIDFDAKIGKEVLKGIIESDSQSCYLGECALVEKDSPIAKENIIYGTTLIDENASCHIALGAGFGECLKNGLNLSRKELLEKGINVSKAHVDFMIGTPDLNIDAITREGKKIPIFQDGNFHPNIIKEAKKC